MYEKTPFKIQHLQKQGQKMSTRTYKSRLKLGQMVKKVNKSQTKSIHKISQIDIGIKVGLYELR